MNYLDTGVYLWSRDCVGALWSHDLLCRRQGKMAAHLSSGRVNLNILREAARKELRVFLDKCVGSKVVNTNGCIKPDRTRA